MSGKTGRIGVLKHDVKQNEMLVKKSLNCFFSENDVQNTKLETIAI